MNMQRKKFKMKSNYLLETEDSVLLENKIEEIIKKTKRISTYFRKKYIATVVLPS